MEVQVAETGPCSRSLQITVPPQSIRQHLEQMYRSAQQQVQIRGFRPGKVPRAIIEKQYGKEILAEAREQLLNRFFGEACRQRDLAPVGRVAIDGADQIEVKPDTPLVFTARIDVRPQFELKGVKGIAVDAFEAEATTADVDAALQEIAHQRRAIRPTTDPVADGDFVRCDFVFVDEHGAEVHSRKGVQLNSRVPIHGTDEAAFTAALVGASAGAQIEIPIRFPDNFEKEAVRGKSGAVRLQLHEVLRVSAPTLDDDFARSLGFETIDALRSDLRQRIGSEKRRLGKLRQEDQCLQKLAAANPIPLPPSLVEEQKQASLTAFARRLEEGGADQEEIQRKLRESDAEAQQDAERRVRLFFLIEAVARQQKIFVTEADVDAELRQIAANNSNAEQQVSAGQVREHLERENRLGELRLALLERKVRDFLTANAVTADKTGS